MSMHIELLTIAFVGVKELIYHFYNIGLDQKSPISAKSS